MKLSVLVLSASLVLLAGCGGKATVNSSSTTGTTNSPAASSTTSVTVSSPRAGAAVSSPFQVSASAAACQSQSVNAIGYSVDASTAVQVTGTALQAQVAAAAGAHTLHVLAWGMDGSSCASDVPITVSASSTSPSDPSSTPGASIPANAVTVSEIQQLPAWKADFDSQSGSGSATGSMSVVGSPSLSGQALAFQTTFTDSGGERYHATFGNDPLATHFVYDAMVYVPAPSDSIANVEMDMNQVVANGQTVIYGFQCDGYSSTWDITENAGTVAASASHWIHTGAACNPRNWTTDTWHHVQIAFFRDNAGNVTYESVWFDGVEQPIQQTVPSAFALNWGSVLLVNFQVDGRGSSGSNTVYLDNFSVSRW